MPPAARISDMTSHGGGLSPGFGSPNIDIGDSPAWRATPVGLASAIEAAADAVKQLLDVATLNPVTATRRLANITANLTGAAAGAAAEGNHGAIGPTAGALGAFTTTNTALSAAWATASAAPGGQPAADIAYTEGVKNAAAAAAAAAFGAIGAITDVHNCPAPATPPHGPGMVARGCPTVFFNDLPACRKGDQVIEAGGGNDAIRSGCEIVLIGA